jgi:integrating conjugative element protein (TIGR03749 family)
MRYVLSVMLLFCLNMATYADSLSSLTLSNSEIQKLKKYFPEEGSDRLTWKGDPLSIDLPINKEKRIVFPSSVSVDVKSALTADQLRILNNDKSLYLTALKSFLTTRIYITLKETGEVILIDIATRESSSSATQQIDIKQGISNPVESGKNIATTTNEQPTQLTENNNPSDDVNFSDLIRSAWQKIYAPQRLAQDSQNFNRTPMHTEKFVSDLVYGDKVIAYPEISWISGNRYVTAILLRNKYQHKTHIDIRKDLCGDWQAGLLYPTANLKPYGEKQGDSAMLFLVSNRPFGEMMGVCHGNA